MPTMMVSDVRSGTETDLSNLIPLNKYVLVKLRERPEGRGGIQIIYSKDRTEDPIVFAEVMKVSGDVEEIREGDVAIFKGSSGRWISDDDSYRMVHESEVLAIEEGA